MYLRLIKIVVPLATAAQPRVMLMANNSKQEVAISFKTPKTQAVVVAAPQIAANFCLKSSVLVWFKKCFNISELYMMLGRRRCKSCLKEPLLLFGLPSHNLSLAT